MLGEKKGDSSKEGMDLKSEFNFLFEHADSSETDPLEPCFEVVVGTKAEHWEVSDPMDLPYMCNCGKCVNDWNALFVLESSLTLKEAHELMITINEAVLYNTNSTMWITVFVEGESPVSIVNVPEDFL